MITATAQAADNSWTSTVDGKWETGANWSLGVAPTNTQSATFITNGVSMGLAKTIRVDATTVLSNAVNGCMTISNLTLAGVGLIRNTLSLNNAGLVTPLRVHNTMTLTGRATVLMSNSVLRLERVTGNNLVIGASTTGLSIFRMDGGQLDMAVNGVLAVGAAGIGDMFVTNATLNLFALTVGSASTGLGTLTIQGSSVIISNQFAVGLNAGATGTVWMTGGDVSLTEDYVLEVGYFGSGQMIVSNGTVRSGVTIGDGTGSSGTLTIAGGSVTVTDFPALGYNSGATGALWMTGGQLIATNFPFLAGYSGRGQMTVSNGSVALDLMVVGSQPGGAGTLTMNGGTVMMSTGLIIGRFDCTSIGIVNVAGGSLFVTNALTNAVLTVRSGTLTLSGGLLKVDKFVMTNACGHFAHTGGVLDYGTAVLDPARDDDADGISNGYEQSHGLDPLNSADANLDNDGDGLSNLQEFLAGTDATNSVSSLRITAITNEGTNTRVTWQTAGGHTNMLQIITGGPGGNFTNNFVDLPPQIIVTGTGDAITNRIESGGATNVPARYYRVRLVP